ncbi:hypothetical protein AN1V17_11710 [Vallitalea sediminicola]
MSKIIKKTIMVLVIAIVNNIADLLIIGGCGVLVTALFLYVNTFYGLIALAIILILFGLIISKVQK